jgi:hypothetical protein
MTASHANVDPVKSRSLVLRMTTIAAAVGCALLGTSQVSAHAFLASPPVLVAQVQGAGFSGAPLAPGGSARRELVEVRFDGPAATSAAGLYLSHYESRGSSSGALCTAASPGSKFIFTVSRGARILFSGSLDAFAAEHSSPETRLPVPGSAGVDDRWAPGDRVTFALSVALDRSAGNSYMECSPSTRFAWFEAL